MMHINISLLFTAAFTKIPRGIVQVHPLKEGWQLNVHRVLPFQLKSQQEGKFHFQKYLENKDHTLDNMKKECDKQVK